MTHGVSDFLTTFFSEKTSLFVHLAFCKNAKGWKLPGKEYMEGEKKGLFSPAQ